MKIDVEGADTWVLWGAENLLRNKSVNEIYYEQNKPRLRQLGIGESDASDFPCSVGYLDPSIGRCGRMESDSKVILRHH